MAEMKMILTCVVLLMMVASSASVESASDRGPTLRDCVESGMKLIRKSTTDPKILAAYQKANEIACTNTLFFH